MIKSHPKAWNKNMKKSVLLVIRTFQQSVHSAVSWVEYPSHVSPLMYCPVAHLVVQASQVRGSEVPVPSHRVPLRYFPASHLVIQSLQPCSCFTCEHAVPSPSAIVALAPHQRHVLPSQPALCRYLQPASLLQAAWA